MHCSLGGSRQRLLNQSLRKVVHRRRTGKSRHARERKNAEESSAKDKSPARTLLLRLSNAACMLGANEQTTMSMLFSIFALSRAWQISGMHVCMSCSSYNMHSTGQQLHRKNIQCRRNAGNKLMTSQNVRCLPFALERRFVPRQRRAQGELRRQENDQKLLRSAVASSVYQQWRWHECA